MNFAGMVICTSSIDFGNPLCKCFESSDDLWIIDSRAFNHITFNKTNFSSITTLPYPILVSFPNEYKVKMTEFGDVPITSEITLHNMLHVPSLKYNLISIHSLTLSLRYIALFTNAFCLQAPSMKRHQVIGNRRMVSTFCVQDV